MAHARRGAAERLRAAFPSSIATDVNAVLSVIPPSEHAPTEHDIGPVRVAGEVLHIPFRIYSPEPPAEARSSLAVEARAVLDCLYTRHHDGHVREKYLRAVISSPLEWVPPFVLQLLGEYVIEIQRLIASNIACLRQPSYARFIGENPAFVALTRRRVISYWSCYFRTANAGIEDHVGYRVMADLGIW